MLNLATLDDAETFVERQQRLGNNVRWDGWDIVFFRPHTSAVYNKAGVWNSQAEDYGFDNRSEAKANGWEVDYRNVKRSTKRPRA